MVAQGMFYDQLKGLIELGIVIASKSATFDWVDDDDVFMNYVKEWEEHNPLLRERRSLYRH